MGTLSQVWLATSTLNSSTFIEGCPFGQSDWSTEATELATAIEINHMEIACQMNDVKMTQHGLLHKGLTSADKDELLHATKF